MADSSTSSTSQTDSNTKQPFHFRAKIEVQNIQVVANLRNLHQHTIKLSIKNLKRKQSNNTQERMAARNQTKDLKCATHLLSDKFRNMSEEKKAIVRDLRFGGLMHIPPLRVDHQLLRELANNFKLGENRLKTGYGSFKITPKIIGDALGINATGDLFLEKVEYKKLSDDDKIIFRRFQDYKEKKKKAIDGCLFALMIIYFHLSKNKGKKRAERPPKPWIANWTKEQLVERMTAEREEILGIVKMAETRAREKMKKKEKKKKKQEIKKTKKRKASSTSSSETETTTDSDTSTSESETQEDSEDSGRKHRSKKGKKMDSRKRKKSQEESDSDSESESESSDESEESSPVEKEKKKKNTKTSPKKTQPKKKKVVVEDSPPEKDQYFDGERYEISSDELEEWLRKNVDKSAAEGENQADLRSTEGRYVSSETIPAVNLGSDDPSSQGRTEQSSVNQPSESMLSPANSNMMVVREQTLSDALAIVPIQVFVPASQTTIETDFEPTPMLQIERTTETHPAAEDAAALLMMARTASYVPKTDPGVPSFSLGLTDSSQEGASTQETERAKSPEAANLIEQLDDLITDDMKQKCYIWGTRLKEDAYGNTNEYEHMCTLIAQDEYILIRMHLASLQAKSDIESGNMALSDYPNGEFISPKTNKEFRVEDYPSFIPFIDVKKLTSHPYGYVFSRLITYAGGEPLKEGKKEKEIKSSYVKISGQKSSYDCAIYVMKWMELIELENIKKGKYEWDNWPQEEVDHYRVEYASRILFSEMNKERDRAIRESNAIRLSKPSSVLLSLFCQINSTDIETA
ncbi:hypothetical protein Ahy_B08g090778 [Arachis hypogaea]|uniref:Ubiquitin-like protease family profile domain-containing protein n=1 Tax=Arachis hypogaea TaxID=3818 RepID=A0A444Y0L5_ARAHY|nr:hypothetical protein Ahy_B08g090778 [Arachis hypogaea]